MISAENSSQEFTIERKFTVLECFERILRNPRLSEEARQKIREMRGRVSQSWQEECAAAAIRFIPETLPDLLEQYIANIRTIHQDEGGYDEGIDILRIFAPSTRQFISYDAIDLTTSAERSRFVLIKTFNNFVQEVDQNSRQIQKTARRVRDLDERWCHHEEERVSIRDIYSLPPDAPETPWARVADELGFAESP
ncbi:hypothetical protein FS837_003127 [Tulasnella sp. UAMH 9824]|nr:hypothetical protein FS837_003127 [Tulasnella sp. UAMH 9824]